MLVDRNFFCFDYHIRMGRCSGAEICIEIGEIIRICRIPKQPTALLRKLCKFECFRLIPCNVNNIDFEYKTKILNRQMSRDHDNVIKISYISSKTREQFLYFIKQGGELFHSYSVKMDYHKCTLGINIHFWEENSQKSRKLLIALQLNHFFTILQIDRDASCYDNFCYLHIEAPAGIRFNFHQKLPFLLTFFCSVCCVP